MGCVFGIYGSAFVAVDGNLFKLHTTIYKVHKSFFFFNDFCMKCFKWFTRNKFVEKYFYAQKLNPTRKMYLRFYDCIRVSLFFFAHKRQIFQHANINSIRNGFLYYFLWGNWVIFDNSIRENFKTTFDIH